MLKISMLLCVALSAGCAFNTQTVDLNPRMKLNGPKVQGGRTININVIDERSTKDLGRRQSSFGPGGEISTDQSLQTIVEERLFQGFSKKGFKVSTKAGAKSNASLVAEIRDLEYEASMGFWTVGTHVNGAIKIRANNKSKRFEKMYRVDIDERSLGTTKGRNAELINIGLGQLLTNIVNDDALIDFLISNN